MKIIETDIMHAFLSVLCVSVHWNSKLEQASFICCSDFVFLLLSCLLFTSLFTFTDFVYIVCLQDKRIYIYVLIELIYYIIKELEITDAVVFQTACIAQDDFFYVAPFKKSLCKIGFGWNFKYWVCQNKSWLFFISYTCNFLSKWICYY